MDTSAGGNRSCCEHAETLLDCDATLQWEDGSVMKDDAGASLSCEHAETVF